MLVFWVLRAYAKKVRSFGDSYKKEKIMSTHAEKDPYYTPKLIAVWVVGVAVSVVGLWLTMKLLGFLWAAITAGSMIAAITVLVLGFVSWKFYKIFSRKTGDKENFEEDS